MRKAWVLFIVVACFAMVFANAETDSALFAFRDIPWGSSIPTVQSLMDGMSFTSRVNDYAANMTRYMYGTGGDIPYDAFVKTSILARPRDSLRVAGYDISSIRLVFAYIPNEQGVLQKDDEHTAFVYGEYQIPTQNPDFVMSDLLAKLTNVYGEPGNHRTGGYSIRYESYVWRDSVGSAISLIHENFSSGSQTVYIRYIYHGIDSYFQQAMDAIAYEELLRIDTNDTEGL